MELTKGFVMNCRNVGALRDFLCQAIDQIDTLTEQNRWHMFCKEKPPEDMMGEEFIVNNGNYSKIAEWGEGYWENDPFCGSKVCDEVVKWKYLD